MCWFFGDFLHQIVKSQRNFCKPLETYVTKRVTLRWWQYSVLKRTKIAGSIVLNPAQLNFHHNWWILWFNRCFIPRMVNGIFISYTVTGPDSLSIYIGNPIYIYFINIIHHYTPSYTVTRFTFPHLNEFWGTKRKVKPPSEMFVGWKTPMNQWIGLRENLQETGNHRFSH